LRKRQTARRKVIKKIKKLLISNKKLQKRLGICSYPIINDSKFTSKPKIRPKIVRRRKIIIDIRYLKGKNKLQNLFKIKPFPLIFLIRENIFYKKLHIKRIIRTASIIP